MNVSTDCSGLQAALNTADANAQGGIFNTYTITLSGTCTEGYTLPNFPSPPAGGDYRRLALRGDPSNGADGFDPTGPGRALTGTNVNVFELGDLTFRDGTQTGDGGAVKIEGESSLGVRNSKFLNNAATGKGGAIYFTQAYPAGAFPPQISLNVQESEFGSQTNPAEGNSAGGDGGAVSVVGPGVLANAGINGSLFANNEAGGNGGGFDWVLTGTGVDNISLNNNTVSSNKARGSGGGAHVKIANATFLNIGSERYEGNSVEPATLNGNGPTPNHFGGGLYIENGGSNIFQRNNVFSGNSVKSFANGQDYGGGGEAIANTTPPDQNNPPTTNSELDRFEANTVVGQANGSAHESEGGGLFFRGEEAVFRARLAVLAANTVGANGDGGGAYAGAAAPAGTLFDFNDSTIAGNAVGAGGEAPGLAGNGNDRLKLRNSIIWNLPKPDIAGFSQVDIAYSDACLGTSTVPPGAGNICADPLLANAAAGNIHQTLASPTVDKGNDDAFFEVAGEGPFTDFEGDPRPVDGDGVAGTADMGADEGPAFVAPVVPIIPPSPVTSSAAKPQCADAKDNDGDGAVDGQDPGCTTAADTNEGDESVSDLVLCGRRTISLVRADLRGGKVRLSGLVAAKVANKPVTILTNYGVAKGSALTKRATVKPNSKGQFSATLPPPPKRLLAKARFQARVGTSRSAALKLPQSLASDSIAKSGASIVIRGKVDRSVLGKRNPVVIQRIVCGRYRTVGSAKPAASGSYVVRFKAPALGAAALYRAQGQVLVRPGSKRYVRQFARALGISLTGQSG